MSTDTHPVGVGATFLKRDDAIRSVMGVIAGLDHERASTDHKHLHAREADNYPPKWPNPSDRLHVDQWNPTTRIRPKVCHQNFMRHGFKRLNEDAVRGFAFSKKPSESPFSIAAAMGHKGSGGLYGNQRSEDLNPDLGGGLIVHAAHLDVDKLVKMAKHFASE